MLTFATVDDLVDHLAVNAPDLDAPAGAARYLQAASRLVSWAIRADLYEAAPSGLPVEPELVDALRDATLEQVTDWVLNEIDPGTVTTTQGARPVLSMSQAGRSVTYAPDDPTVTAARARSADELCGSAVLVLRLAGFCTGQPVRY